MTIARRGYLAGGKRYPIIRQESYTPDDAIYRGLRFVVGLPNA